MEIFTQIRINQRRRTNSFEKKGIIQAAAKKLLEARLLYIGLEKDLSYN